MSSPTIKILFILLNTADAFASSKLLLLSADVELLISLHCIILSCAQNNVLGFRVRYTSTTLATTNFVDHHTYRQKANTDIAKSKLLRLTNDVTGHSTPLFLTCCIVLCPAFARDVYTVHRVLEIYSE
jgi:hypothetical protein